MLKTELGLEVSLVEGDRGEFTVWVDDEIVSKKGWRGFPKDEDVLEKLRAALAK